MKDPRSSAQWINIRLQNAGTLPATRIVVGAIGKSSSKAFAPEVEKKEMDDLRVKVNATPRRERVLGDRILWVLLIDVLSLA
jgi:hypothetical protein